ncbi:MAG: hypothetical protein ACRDJ9_15975 [Dehalococcoidia bacterium]
MGVIYEYFAADSDERAAAVIDNPKGPAESGLAMLPAGGIEPAIQLSTLEELLTGTPFEEIVQRPRSTAAIAERADGQLLVLTLTDEFQAALAEASPERLTEVAEPWSKSEEFFGDAAPEDLTPFLSELATLAREALATGQRLYCWVCV